MKSIPEMTNSRKFEKSAGTTPSEEYLAYLSDKTFLSLWSYPNVFRTPSKELCDLLVVCDNKVIIFSDKSVKFQTDVPIELAWSRWYNRAINKSAAQIKRARNWIKEHPNKLFLDPKCTKPFPINLPEKNNLEVHSIIVATGSTTASKKFFGSGSGALLISPEAAKATNATGSPVSPFTVGNPDNSGDFCHVFDEVTLNILLRELDTIADFTHYLSRKRALIERGNLLIAPGEEDLLAIYLRNVDNDGYHEFTSGPDSTEPLREGELLVVEEGSYKELRRRNEYKRKKKANRVSYLWDSLIETFAKNVREDTLIVPPGAEHLNGNSKAELGLRQMALVDRLERRSNSEAITGAFKSIGKNDRFFRAMIPGPTQQKQGTGFFILLVKRSACPPKFSDDDYRKFRSYLCYAYALNLLKRNPSLEIVVGIATEGEPRGGRSEDLVYAEQPDWTTENLEEADLLRTKFDIFKNDTLTETRIQPFEYPESDQGLRGQHTEIPYHFIEQVQPDNPVVRGGNRRQRRAAKAKSRRKGQ